MNLLFIHGNFPGQFLKLAPFLVRQLGGVAVFLSESDNPQNIKLDGVELVTFQLHRKPSDGIHRYLYPSENAVLRGQAVLRALDQLRHKGFVPDVAIVHGGQGFGLYLKTLLPQMRLVSYMEWYFGIETSQYLFADFSIDNSLAIQTRNWPIVQELMQADQIVSPTDWQRRQFPLPWRDRINTIFDGVDTEFFRPAVQAKQQDLQLLSGTNGQMCHIPLGTPMLTYATRGMEPLRGFAEFMRAAAFAQQQIPDLHVVVAGDDRVAYSYLPQHSSGSWKQQLLEELDGRLDLSRLHFPGLLNYGELMLLFQHSDLHCYFTHPYVISWGLFQAAACGARLLINDFPGFEEIFRDPEDVVRVNLENQESIDFAVLKILQSSNRQQKSNLRPGLELATTQQAWLRLING